MVFFTVFMAHIPDLGEAVIGYGAESQKTFWLTLLHSKSLTTVLENTQRKRFIFVFVYFSFCVCLCNFPTEQDKQNPKSNTQKKKEGKKEKKGGKEVTITMSVSFFIKSLNSQRFITFPLYNSLYLSCSGTSL